MPECKSDVFITRCVVRVIRVISLYRFKTLYAIDVNVNSGVKRHCLRYLDRFFVVMRFDYFGTATETGINASWFPVTGINLSGYHNRSTKLLYMKNTTYVKSSRESY